MGTQVDYLIRELGKGKFEVTKWEEWGGKRPNALYVVELNPESWRECSCLGSQHHGYCKHSLMVTMWISDGKPVKVPIVLGLGPYGWGL